MALSKEQPNQENSLLSSQAELSPQEQPMEELVDLLLELQEEKKSFLPLQFLPLQKKLRTSIKLIYGRCWKM